MKKIFKILLKIVKIIVLIILVILLTLLLFIKIYKPFGTSPSKKDRIDYAKRIDLGEKGEFQNSNNFSLYTNWIDKYKSRTTNKGTTPKEELPYKNYKYKIAKEDEVFITWFGHSSVLIQIGGKNILIDPVFEDIVSPVSFIGVKRFSELPVKIKDLPHIDVILLTHDHYDHESYTSLTALENKTDKYIVPLGIEKDLEKFGIDKDKIQNIAWWEETKIDNVLIASTPSRHYSGRYILDNNKSLWTSWIIKTDKYTIFDSGDTGYGEQFKEIYEKYGEIDLALLDSGEYNVSWHDVHMFPEEAVNAGIDLHALVSMPIHYGAFVLSNHSWDDPVDRFVRYAKENNVEYLTPILGETVNLEEYTNYQLEWWKDIK